MKNLTKNKVAKIIENGSISTTNKYGVITTTYVERDYRQRLFNKIIQTSRIDKSLDIESYVFDLDGEYIGTKNNINGEIRIWE